MPERTFGGPYVQVAAICQTSIVDNQGLLSIIRCQDRIQVVGLTDEMKPQPLQNFQFVLALRAGEMRGKSTLRITPIAPTGKRLAHIEAPMLFEGEERGNVIQAPLPVVAEEEGLYWLEITLDGVLLTRVPFRVLYQKVAMPPGLPFPPPNIG